MAAARPAFLPPPPTGTRVGGTPRHAAAVSTCGGVLWPHQRLRGGGGALLLRRPAPPRRHRKGGGGVTMAEGEGEGAGAAAAADAPSTPPPMDMDAAFARLGHKNEVMRKRVRWVGGGMRCLGMGVRGGWFSGRLWWPWSRY